MAVAGYTYFISVKRLGLSFGGVIGIEPLIADSARVSWRTESRQKKGNHN